MGGITGFLDHSTFLTEQDLLKASATLRHRGGNGNGFIFEKTEHYNLGIASERLATIDTSDKGNQPLTSSCGNYSITFNGTIYNYIELRENLIKYGVIFSTLTDTEVILESYKKWGKEAFEKLDGSFAFVILDKKLNQLLIVRDEIGAKPLYFFKLKNCYAFASEISAILSYPVFEKKVNKNAIATYFRYGYFTGDETIYENIFKAKSGYTTTIDIYSGNSYDAPIKRKLKVADLSKKHEGLEENIINEIEDILTETILKRIIGDVPVGLLLNSGYDSAVIAAILQKNQSKRIKTYSVSFRDGNLSETKQIGAIAKYLKTIHHEYIIDQNKVSQIVRNLPNIFESPIGNINAISLLFIAEKAKKDVKVLLNADGGNQLFGGYKTYNRAFKYQKFSELKVPKIFINIVNNLLKATNPKRKAIIEADSLLNKYLEINACFTIPQVEQLVNSSKGVIPKSTHNATSIKDLLKYDLKTFLPSDLLYKSDKCMMHFGIENRAALLNSKLINYLSELDLKWFINDKELKYLLKKITHQYIPKKLIRKNKSDFDLPLALWLNTILKPLVDQYLTLEKLNEHQLLDVNEVFKIKAAFESNNTAYNAKKIWLILQFQMWYERWIKEV